METFTEQELTVVFNNEFSKEVITGLTPQEHDMLMAVLAKLKRKGGEEVNITFLEIQELLHSKDGEERRIRPNEINELSNSLWNKVKMVDYTLYAFGKPSGGVMLFSHWGIDEDEQALTVQINPSLEYFVNSFEKGNYSSLNYRDFQRTHNGYGKRLHQLLSQWSSVGYLKISADELKHKLDTPSSYRKPTATRKFHERVLNPAISSVSPFFLDLSVEKLRTNRRISHYEFRFTPQKRAKDWTPKRIQNPSVPTFDSKQKENKLKDVTNSVKKKDNLESLFSEDL